MCKAWKMLIIRFFYSLLQTRNFGSIQCIVLIDIERRHGLSKVHDLTLKTKEDIHYSQPFGKMYSLYYRYCVSTIVVIFLVSSIITEPKMYIFGIIHIGLGFVVIFHIIGECSRQNRHRLNRLPQQIIHFQLLREMIVIAQKAFPSSSRATCKVHLKRAKSDHQLPIKK